MKTCITHGTSELGMDLFLRDGFLKPSIRIGNLPTSLDGSFCNVAYTPFILQIKKEAIHDFDGKPCFYLPGNENGIYLDNYGVFGVRYMWEWEIFFNNAIPMDYVEIIYVVTIGGHLPNGVNLLVENFNKEYDNIKVIHYDFFDRYKFWGDARGYRDYRHVKKIIETWGITYEELTNPKYKKVLEYAMEYINDANTYMAKVTNSMDIYEDLYHIFEKKYLNINEVK